MNLCVTVEGSPRVNALPSSSSSTWPEMSNKSNPVSLLPHIVYVCIYIYIPPSGILLSERHWNWCFETYYILGLCADKMVIPFCFGITNRSCLQGSRSCSRTCLGNIQLAHIGCLLGGLTYWVYIAVADFQGRHRLVYIFKGKLWNIFITHHSELVSCDWKWGIWFMNYSHATINYIWSA